MNAAVHEAVINDNNSNIAVDGTWHKRGYSSLNGVRIPKTVFVGIETVKFGVMDAVICFNDGYVSRTKVFEALGIKPGYNTECALLIIDNKRIFEAERIVNKVLFEARNKRSLKRKMDKQNIDEENEYQAGTINQIDNAYGDKTLSRTRALDKRFSRKIGSVEDDEPSWTPDDSNYSTRPDY
ncbi:hypothetical protein TNCV_2590591 [Trichonephila clavipes]|nr:hypothetical protein TNCV_2590591 [Trichonephila clavipes]